MRPTSGRACDWLIKHQQDTGGWGESCASYMDGNAAGRGVATASQTAWAMIALLAANRAQDRDAIDRGVLFLIERQTDGTWEEEHYTGDRISGLRRRPDHQAQRPLVARTADAGIRTVRAPSCCATTSTGITSR